jgi:hypothetical protein
MDSHSPFRPLLNIPPIKPLDEAPETADLCRVPRQTLHCPHLFLSCLRPFRSLPNMEYPTHPGLGRRSRFLRKCAADLHGTPQFLSIGRRFGSKPLWWPRTVLGKRSRTAREPPEGPAPHCANEPKTRETVSKGPQAGGDYVELIGGIFGRVNENPSHIRKKTQRAGSSSRAAARSSRET